MVTCMTTRRKTHISPVAMGCSMFHIAVALYTASVHISPTGKNSHVEKIVMVEKDTYLLLWKADVIRTALFVS